MLFLAACFLLSFCGSACGEVHEEIVTTGAADYVVTVGGTMDEFNTSRCGHLSHGGYTCRYQPNVLFEIANVGTTNVSNPRVLINGRREWFTQPDIVNEVFPGATTAEEKTFALWNWCRKSISGGATYGPPLWGDTQSIVLFMNSFGTGACGTYHRVMPLIGAWAGLEAYGGCQASCSHATQKEQYGGAFHYFDCMLRSGDMFQPQGYFCLALDNTNIVGTEELAQDHYLSDRVGTVPEFYWMTSLFGGPGESYGLMQNWTDPRTMNITLRPGEALRHGWSMETVLWNGEPGGDGTNANGQVHYEPILTHSGVSYSAELASNLAYTTFEGRPAVSVAGDNTTARLGYSMYSPYVVVGGRMGLNLTIPAGCSQGCVKLLVQFEGSTWSTVWTSGDPGDYTVEADFSNRPEFRDPNLTHGFHVRLEMTSGTGVTPKAADWWIDAVFQSYALSLPALGVGENTVSYSDSSASRSVRIRHEWVPSEDVPPPSPPFAPIFPADGGEAGFNSVFTWEPAAADPAYPVDQYEFYLSGRPDLAWPLLTSMQHVINGATNSFSLPTPDALVDGRTYHWRVRARNTEGLWGDWTDAWTFTARGPGQPRNLTAHVNVSEGTAILTWEPPATGRPAVAYEVYGDTQHGFTPLRRPKKQCSTSCDSWSRTFPTNLLATTTELSIDVTNRNEAHYRVCAIDADGNRSVPTQYVRIHTPMLAPRTPPPANLYEPFEFTVNCTRKGGNYVFTLGQGMILQGGDTLSFELLNAPSWMSIDYESGEITGVPSEVGQFEYTVRVTDGQGGTDTRTYPIEVLGDPNAPTPTARPTPTQTPYTGSVCLGTGADGPVEFHESIEWDAPRAQVTGIQDSELTLGTLNGSGTFSQGDEVLIIQMRHSDADMVGQYEFVYVESFAAPVLTLSSSLSLPFSITGEDRVQAVRVAQYTTVRIRQAATVSVPVWNGADGGIIAIRATGHVSVEGTINAAGAGYRGGGGQGEGYPGPAGQNSPAPNGNGGGQGQSSGYCSGGGGGNAVAGGPGTCEGGGTSGSGGLAVGVENLSRLTLGGGGGTGLGPQFNCCCAGAGGGIVAVSAGSLSVDGAIRADGSNGAGPGGCGGPGPDTKSGGVGGGAGGSIALEVHADASLGYSQVTARGGSGGAGSSEGPYGGNGGVGRIAVRSEGSLSGVSVPVHNTLSSLCPDATPAVIDTPTPAPTPTAYSGDACLGSGRDGVLTISGNSTWSAPRAGVTEITSANLLRLGTVSGTGDFAAGDEVLIVQIQNNDPAKVGTFEFAEVQSYSSPQLHLSHPLINTYDLAGNSRVQVARVPHHSSVTVNGGVTLAAPAWNGTDGGIIAFRATGSVSVDGKISASGAGFRGVGMGQGEGFTGPGGGISAEPNGNGGGMGMPNGYCSGGGGGHAAAGTSGSCAAGGTPGQGGLSVGVADLSRLSMGGGGGTGRGPDNNCCCSGAGGGIIVISGGEIIVNGLIESNGANGAGGGNCGGPGPDQNSGGVAGGAGGSIAIAAHTSLALGTGWVTAWGGSGGSGVGSGPSGGGGSYGRIAVSCDGTLSGWTNPAHETLLSLCPSEPRDTPTPTPAPGTGIWTY
jgi:hypothetical protein